MIKCVRCHEKIIDGSYCEPCVKISREIRTKLFIGLIENYKDQIVVLTKEIERLKKVIANGKNNKADIPVSPEHIIYDCIDNDNIN